MQIFHPAFRAKWKLASVDPLITAQQMTSFQQPSAFVRLCPLGRRPNLHALALQQRCSELDIRVLNNLLSERAASSYRALFVPVAKPQEIEGKHLRFHRGGATQRILPVRFPADLPAGCQVMHAIKALLHSLCTSIGDTQTAPTGCNRKHLAPMCHAAGLIISA